MKPCGGDDLSVESALTGKGVLVEHDRGQNGEPGRGKSPLKVS